jgi:hypothetical protein
MSIQPTKIVTAIPAAGGMIMAKIPATIITMLIIMDHPKDFFTNVGTELAAALLMSIPPMALRSHIPIQNP